MIYVKHLWIIHSSECLVYRIYRVSFQSLTLTQLAELHDKICELTSDMVQQDSKAVPCEAPQRSENSTDILNKRIAALQKQIAEKQMEAGWKLQELKRALRNEQANLIRLSNEMNLERQRNFNLQSRLD